jgi:hypothetical protein
VQGLVSRRPQKKVIVQKQGPPAGSLIRQFKTVT